MIFKLFLFLFLFPCLTFGFEEEITVSEYDLKAVFIFHFIKYFEWTNFENKEYFEISVFGKSPILEPLVEISNKKLALGKKIQIKKIDVVKEIGKPQILFLPRSSLPFLSDILKETENKQILIIGEEEGICEKGIAVNFVLREGNIKFEINEAVLKKKGIKPSSQILKLATSRLGEKE